MDRESAVNGVVGYHRWMETDLGCAPWMKVNTPGGNLSDRL